MSPATTSVKVVPSPTLIAESAVEVFALTFVKTMNIAKTPARAMMPGKTNFFTLGPF